MSNTQSYPETVRFYQHVTKTTWLHLEDALVHDKIRLFAGTYARGEGSKETAAHYLDVDDARVLFADLSWAKDVDHVDFKGSANADGEIISRVLRVNSQDDKVYFNLTQGPGKLTDTGAVLPHWKALRTTPKSINVALTRYEARRMALAALEHIQVTRILQALNSTTPLPEEHRNNGNSSPQNGQADIPAYEDQLFGETPPAQPKKKARKTPVGNHRGNAAVAHTNGPIKTADQFRDGHYANGDPVAETDLPNYQLYKERMRGVPPYNQEKLISWIYRN